MKKRLIDLMIENDVVWPDGAEYAVQDKDEFRLCFYKERAERNPTDWSWSGRWPMIKSEKLPELCRNWHQTVVTKEQYEKAVMDKLPEHLDSISDNRLVTSLIDKIAECDKHINHHNAELATWTEGRAKFVRELTELMGSVGLKVVAIDDSSDAPLDITDWRNLKIGDIIEVTACNDCKDGRYAVLSVEDVSYNGDYPFEIEPCWPEIDECKWRFIRRP